MIKLVLLYWLLLQSVLSSFTGLSSLPIIHHAFVTERDWIDDRQLNAAVMIGRSTPGPMGVYVVCVGYFVAGYPGAAVGAVALATPALIILLLLRLLKDRVDQPRIRNAIRYVILSATAYSASALFSMSRSALTSAWLIAIGIGSCALMAFTRIPTIWILLGAGIVGVMIQ